MLTHLGFSHSSDILGSDSPQSSNRSLTEGNSILATVDLIQQARSQDFCVGGRFEQKVDLFVLFFLSVKGGGGCGDMRTRLCFKPLCC